LSLVAEIMMAKRWNHSEREREREREKEKVSETESAIAIDCRSKELPFLL